MAEEPRKKKSNVAVWVVLGLLILALGGFGATGFGSSLSSVATVGDRDITVQQYADAMQGEMNRLRQQTGQNLTIDQMQAFGLDRAVMERLLAAAALDHETSEVGVSVGDAEVARRIRENPAFGGVAGGFDREGYAFALRSAGLNEARFEEQVREEAGREILQIAVISGTAVPDIYVDTLASWIAETRDATLTTITTNDLPGGPIAPTEDDLRAFYDEDPERFQTPELRAITYAWIAPETVVGTITLDDEQLRRLYDDRADEFRQPARVLAERLAFADAAAADAARAAIDAGERTFDAFVEERGLTLDDVDQGELSRDDLDQATADALFALEEPGLVGPLPTSLGPALYRVNAILDATEVPFDAVRGDLAAEAGLDAARSRIDSAREDIDDLLAGGAVLEDLPSQTDMVLGTIQWDPTNTEGDGIAAYDEFRSAAIRAQTGDFPELEELSDGGLFALRLDEVVPPATPPFADVRDTVEQAWRSDSATARLLERAEGLAADADSAGDAPVGTTETLAGIARDGTVEGAPRALIDRLFDAEAGETFAVAGDAERAFVVTLDAVNTADLTEGEGADLRQAIETQMQNGMTGDLFESYGQAVQEEAGFTVDQQAIDAVQTQIGGGHGGGHGG